MRPQDLRVLLHRIPPTLHQSWCSSSSSPSPFSPQIGSPGDMLNWRQFWSLFSVCIEREIGLTNAEKISCLEEAMQDPAAKSIVRQQGYECDYDIVVKVLHIRYERHKLVFRHYVNHTLSLRYLTTMTATSNSMILSSNITMACRPAVVIPTSNSTLLSWKPCFPILLQPLGLSIRPRTHTLLRHSKNS